MSPSPRTPALPAIAPRRASRLAEPDPARPRVEGDSEADRQAQILSGQARLLREFLPQALGTLVIAVTVLGFALAGGVATHWLASWIAASLGLVAYRAWMWRGFARLAPARHWPWVRRYFIVTALSGVVWGALPVALFPADGMRQLFIIFMAAGISAGAVVAYAPVAWLAPAFMLPLLLPLSLRVWTLQPGLAPLMGFMIAVYAAALTALSLTQHRTVKMGLRLRVENELLAARLEREIAQRVDAESQRESLRQSQQWLRQIARDVPAPICVLDARDWTVTVTNAPCRELLGLGEDSAGRPLGACLADPEHLEPVRRALARGEARVFAEVRLPGADGAPRWALLSASPSELNGRPSVLVGLTDITAVKQSEQEVRAGRRLLRALVDSLPFSIYAKDRAGRYILVNERMAALHGMKEEELIGRGVAELPHRTSGQAESAEESDERVMVSGTPLDLAVVPVRLADGRQRQERMLKMPIRDDDGNVTGLVGWAEDITARREAQQALEASEQRFRNLVEGSLQGVLIHQDLRPLFANQALAGMFGFASAEALVEAGSLAPRLNPEDVSHLRQGLLGLAAHQDGRDYRHIVRGFRGGGTALVVESFSKPIVWEGSHATLSMMVDVTERARLEDQLRQAQKMEVVGQFAGGVAHDFNNLLQVIRGYADLARRTAAEDAPTRLHWEHVMKATETASGLTQRLLAFSRRQVFRPVPQDVHGLLDNLAGMLRRLLGEQYEIVLKPDAAAPVVAVDAGMLDQVIVNLCLNARDAMPDGGAIAIATGEVDADAEFCRLRGWNTPGRFVTISVTDAGTGMSDGVRRRIFEPFFTTKDVGKGTGLGLSIVYGIVEQHGGRIEVESAPGRGSAFHIYLPVAEERPPADAETARAEVPGGTETLLVAEDDPMLLDLTLQLLAEKGYRVLTARDGLEAVQLFASHITEIDLVLMDVIMPRMSGRAAYDQIRAIAPDLPVIFVTGYSGEALDAPLTKRPDFHLIRKPYAADALFTKIRQVLDRYGKAPKPDADKGQTQLPGSG